MLVHQLTPLTEIAAQSHRHRHRPVPPLCAFGYFCLHENDWPKSFLTGFKSNHFHQSQRAAHLQGAGALSPASGPQFVLSLGLALPRAHAHFATGLPKGSSCAPANQARGSISDRHTHRHTHTRAPKLIYKLASPFAGPVHLEGHLPFAIRHLPAAEMIERRSSGSCSTLAAADCVPGQERARR